MENFPISKEDINLLQSLGWTFHYYGGDFQEGWLAPGRKFRKSKWRTYYNWEEVQLFLDGYKASQNEIKTEI